MVQELRTASGERLVFEEPVKILVEQGEGPVTARIPDLAEEPDMASAEGNTEAEALGLLAQKIRDETGRMHRLLAHRMTARERERRGRLWVLVDVARSGLLPGVLPETWAFGRLERDGERLRFRDMGEDGGIYDLDTEVEQGVTSGVIPLRGLRFAKVKAGEAGEAVGPVLMLESPVSPLAGDLAASIVRSYGEDAGALIKMWAGVSEQQREPIIPETGAWPEDAEWPGSGDADAKGTER